ncbi:hypothetical protein Barb6XT_00799 [Bacteroidales bacterium Barb6XT]|nr:hypothetical protein Barb6XT_00799 [Bacteroidales bacterium Barb6XT]
MLPNKIKLQLHIVHIGGNRYNSILLQTYGNFNKWNKHMRISSGHSFRVNPTSAALHGGLNLPPLWDFHGTTGFTGYWLSK